MNIDNLNIITFNVRGLNNHRKRIAIFDYLNVNNCDIAFLQETFSDEEVETKWRNDWGGKIIYLHGTKHSKGLAIMFKRNLDITVITEEKDKFGRYIYLKIKWNDRNINLINVYAPNKESEQIAFIKSLQYLMGKHEDISENCLIGGDFNIPIDIKLDKKGGKNQVVKKQYTEKIREFINDTEMIDIWRHKNKNKKQYTWRQATNKIYCRLDYFLISQNNIDIAKSSKIMAPLLSDHSPVLVQIQFLEEPHRGPGHWKFNLKLLNDEEYKIKIKELIKTLQTKYDKIENKCIKWDLFKYEIRKFTITFSKHKKKEKLNLQAEKQKQLELLLSQNYEGDEGMQNSITQLQEELNEIYTEEAEGIKMRSRVQWTEEGEKNTKYFYNLEKANYKKKNIKKLVVNNVEITNQKEILNTAKDFYTQLYSRCEVDSTDILNYLNQTDIPKLTVDEKTSCEGKITKEECESVIKYFVKNKTPGNDGIPIEFYSEFWPEIYKDLLQCYDYSFQSGNLSTTQKQAVITLIHKPDKDKEYLENWRPISLLNVDYKILTKCLAERIKKIIKKVIHNSQFGFIKGRTIHDAIRTILDIVDYTSITNKPAMMLAIDFQKAFDTLSWEFLFSSLKLYNFGNEFIEWIKICYTNISSCIINYGYCSPYFKLERGVRQGDPMSPYLFILALEILSTKIRNNKDIKGIKVTNEEIKLINYADDTTIFIDNINSAQRLLKLLQNFGKVSGLKINRTKSEGFWLGKNKDSNLRPLGLKWKKCIKLLGIHISYDKEDMLKQNFYCKLSKIRNILNSWKQRDLTIFGKILLIKSYALSNIMYSTTVLVPNNDFLKTLEEIIFEFLWKGKQHKVKKDVIIQDNILGGCNMVHLKYKLQTQQLNWIRKYFAEDQFCWKQTMRSILNKYSLDIYLQSNFEVPENISEFYSELLKTWKSLKTNRNTSKTDILNQYIWYNQSINTTINEQVLEPFIDKGIKTVKDITKSDGTFKTFSDIQMEYKVQSKYYLSYQRLISSVPKTWKNILKTTNDYQPNTNTNLMITINDEEVDMIKNNNKQIYNLMIKQKYTMSKAQTIYTEKYQIEEEEWFKYNLYYKKIHIPPKIKEHQYKILHDYIVTNKKLFKMNIISSPRCNFCNLYPQDTEHMFFTCMNVRNFWFDINEWLLNEFGLSLDLSAKCILLGEISSLQELQKMSLYAKYFISKCKLKETIPDVKQFRNYIGKYEF